MENRKEQLIQIEKKLAASIGVKTEADDIVVYF